MPRRIEDEIRSLCEQIVAGKDDDQQIKRLVELQAALRLHIQRMRARVVDYPGGSDRRQEETMPPIGTGD
jgi:hypothetical protein